MIDLRPRELSAQQSHWLSMAALVVGILVWVFVDSFAVAVLVGGIMRTAMPMVLGTSGRERRIAIVLNVAIYGFLLGMLALAYNARAILDLIGAGR
ncbi:MAG: hypothetical protein KY467_10525 [Gemmatimonadetes bacterium]|nr:hypothetical protein [Gemmatimonadota bacterium]